MIHDTSDAVEAKETLVEAVLEVVSELPKTLEATRGRLVLGKFEKLPVRSRGQESLIEKLRRRIEVRTFKALEVAPEVAREPLEEREAVPKE